LGVLLPISATKKDAPQKTRENLGFSSFFACFQHFAREVLLFSKFEKQCGYKDAKRILGMSVRT